MATCGRFETAALVAATASMKAFLDVYHALYRCVVEVSEVVRTTRTAPAPVEAFSDTRVA